MAGQDRGGLHWAWIVLGTCFINLFINYSARLGYGVILPEMITDLDLSRTAGGSIFNAYLLTYVAVTPLTGYLTDRLGARGVITVCALVLGVGVTLMGTVNSLWTACLFFAVVGLGATGMWTSVITLVQRWYVPRRRGLALGILSTGYGLGFATMGAAFPWIVKNFDWRHAWYFLGAGALLMVVVNGLLLKSDPRKAGYSPWGGGGTEPSEAAARPAGPDRAVLGRIFRGRTFWLIGASYFCVAYSLYGITTFMVDYAEHQLGLPLEKSSLLATIHGVCQVAGVLTILPLSDRWGRRRTIMLSNFGVAVALTGIVLLGHSWPALCVLVGIIGVFYGVTFPIYGACAGDYFPRGVMGTVIGVWTTFYGLGAILVHWVSGLIRDASGRYDYAFLINAAMAAVGLVLIACVNKREGPDSSGSE